MDSLNAIFMLKEVVVLALLSPEDFLEGIESRLLLIELLSVDGIHLGLAVSSGCLCSLPDLILRVLYHKFLGRNNERGSPPMKDGLGKFCLDIVQILTVFYRAVLVKALESEVFTVYAGVRVALVHDYLQAGEDAI